jgi:hypothetical protein
VEHLAPLAMEIVIRIATAQLVSYAFSEITWKRFQGALLVVVAIQALTTTAVDHQV